MTSGTSPSGEIRTRRPDDFAALEAALWEQQPHSRYPYRRPLPVSIEQFLHGGDAASAWTATVDGVPVGHGCWVPGAADGADPIVAACAEAHRARPERLGWVSSLFVGSAGRRTGLGRRLLATIVADIRAAGMAPCLEVLPVNDSAVSLYASEGWREVLRVRPPWLAEADPEGHDPDVSAMVLRS